jgi:hypothetical protein
MSPTVALVWYLVVSGPQGGLTTMPGYFDTREECASAITEYQKQPANGWSASCVPSTSPYDESDDTTDGGDDTGEQPAQ